VKKLEMDFHDLELTNFCIILLKLTAFDEGLKPFVFIPFFESPIRLRRIGANAIPLLRDGSNKKSEKRTPGLYPLT
jgi:hypothetical protein